jgi:hypothetical protein
MLCSFYAETAIVRRLHRLAQIKHSDINAAAKITVRPELVEGRTAFLEAVCGSTSSPRTAHKVAISILSSCLNNMAEACRRKRIG